MIHANNQKKIINSSNNNNNKYLLNDVSFIDSFID